MKSILVFWIISFFSFLSFAQTNPRLTDEAFDILEGKNVSYPIKFAVIGDTQREDLDFDTPPVYPMLPELLQSIRSKSPHFAICVGDLTKYSDAREYDSFVENVTSELHAYGIPLFSLPGNHEYYPWNTGISGSGGYFDVIHDKLNYAFDFGNLKFMLIDNCNTTNYVQEYKILDETIIDVKQWMLKMRQENKLGFVFGHVPLYEFEGNDYSRGINPNWSEQGQTGVQENFPELHELIKHNNIEAFISGHQHRFAHGFADPNPADGDYGDGNIEYYISGGGLSWDGDDSWEKNHWLLFTVDECGKTTVEVNWIDPIDLEIISHDESDDSYNFSFLEEVENVDYYANTTITASSNYVIEENVNVEFIAGERILLLPGFEAKPESEFLGRICKCSSGSLKSLELNTKYNNELDKDYVIFPNPTTGSITINIDQSEIEASNLALYNSFGIQLNPKITVSNGSITMDLANVPNGMYLVRVYYMNKEYVTKIIKSNQ